MNFPIYLVKVILCIKTITRLSFQKPFLESISFSFQINSLFILKSFHFFHITSLMMNIREEKTNTQISFYPFCQRKGRVNGNSANENLCCCYKCFNKTMAYPNFLCMFVSYFLTLNESSVFVHRISARGISAERLWRCW